MNLTRRGIGICLSVITGSKKELMPDEAEEIGIVVDGGVYVIPPVVEHCERIITSVLVHTLLSKTIILEETRIGKGRKE